MNPLPYLREIFYKRNMVAKVANVAKKTTNAVFLCYLCDVNVSQVSPYLVLIRTLVRMSFIILKSSLHVYWSGGV
jgi:hypothetical protein